MSILDVRYTIPDLDKGWARARARTRIGARVKGLRLGLGQEYPMLEYRTSDIVIEHRIYIHNIGLPI